MTSPTASSQWIQTTDALASWLTELTAPVTVAMDTEFMRRDTFYPQLALVQLSAAGSHVLIDPLAFDPGPLLQDAQRQHGWTTIMHSASEDLEALSQIFPGGPTQLYDTQIAASLSGMGLSLSYRSLVEAVTGISLDKGETRSDWLQRPLTEAQRGYATLDVVYLEAVKTHLDTQLTTLGRHEWLQEECERLKQRSAGRHIDSQPQRFVRPAAEWPLEQQALLRRLLLWRERTARDINRPKTWLLDDNHALDLVAQLPPTRDELDRRTRGLRALRAAQREDLFCQLSTPLSQSEVSATAPVLGLIQGEAKRTLAAMKNLVDHQAAKLELPSGLLCPRKVLEEYVLSGQAPALWEGWRKPWLAQPLAELLA